MAVRCTFTLNNKQTSTLACSGYGTVEAFSGQMRGRDNPAEVATKDIGPIPPGTYYIVDRQSGGMLGDIRDRLAPIAGSTDRTKWFTLWNPRTGDSTKINGVIRSHFRIHPEGSRAVSEGCITLVNPAEFELLQRYIRRSPPVLPVPGSTLKAYGTVEVK
ncbi:DUF2778 domain-containing protein [Caballeronia sp. NK8]|uniref:DUF2778 domain-containing protein n=1 Tax=Caballeronia sp. NK8 TaxID=140098 RepID=UPI001BB4D4C9|nr:DUF2778 domain-containing protein [Caballeronia sp. NK8]BCQ24773.1 DUF2778 domain-containing protein [Caballeronia sp. NK8]